MTHFNSDFNPSPDHSSDSSSASGSNSGATPNLQPNELLQYVDVPTPQELLERRQTAARLGKQIHFLQHCLKQIQTTYRKGGTAWVYFDSTSITLSEKQVDEVIAALAERNWKATRVKRNSLADRIEVTALK
ncbi:MAG: hypothetical protein Q8T09_02025 [Candidatus Melainabacteria bacterium]|nr:hypothetical protein [Candidatus Melainabacteria bacterium]